MKSGLTGRDSFRRWDFGPFELFGMGSSARAGQGATLYFADPFHPGGQIWHIFQIFRADRDRPAEFVSVMFTPMETFEPFDAEVALLNTFVEKIGTPATDPADILRWRRNASVLRTSSIPHQADSSTCKEV